MSGASQDIDADADVGVETVTDEETIKFYNYHEYALITAESQISELGYTLPSSKPVPAPILLTHFESPYPPAQQPTVTNSAQKSVTMDPEGISVATSDQALPRRRVVRIPREFAAKGDLVPQFSTWFPGTEPGALETEIPALAMTSASPLRIWLDPSEVAKVVKTVNGILEEALSPYKWTNVFDSLMDVFCCWTWSKYLAGSNTKRKLKELERFLDTENEKLRKNNVPVRYIQPERSGFLSFDVEIPDPPPLQEYMYL